MISSNCFPSSVKKFTRMIMTEAQVSDVVTLSVINGVLFQAPIYELHATRAVNYLAIIDVDGTCPGGLSRRFASKVRGEGLFAVEQIGVLDALEFAADKAPYFAGGNKTRNRWYGVVVEKTAEHMRVEKCKSGPTAILRARELRAERDKPVPYPAKETI